MNTLIVFAGKYGCTEKCAELVAKRLNGHVEILDLKKSADIDIDRYQKVIIGSSLYYGKIQKETAEFCSQHLESLKEKKLGLFVCGMQAHTSHDAINNNFPEELLKGAKISEYFGGEFNFDKMGFMERTIVKKIAKANTNISDIQQGNIERFIESMNSI